ncbi:MAG: hypothetical protein KKB50_15060 [Planctomycetes bacterium]|nr:hypothetical protein [Planctomycetota bacterium]
MSSMGPTAGLPSADALPENHAWEGRPGDAEVTPLPGCPAVYLLSDAEGAPVQLATTQQLRRAVKLRLADSSEQRRGKADLAEIVRRIMWRRVYSPLEGRWWYYRLAREMYPREYRRLVSFGPAWFLHVDWNTPCPELRVTERIWCLSGAFVGPWPTRTACQQAWDGLCDLFDLCRYPEQVRRAPNGERCAYADMGRCDAACDGSVPLAAYVARCRAAWQFASGDAEGWIAVAEREMRAAAADRRYERAGQIKQQLAFARRWQSQWASAIRSSEDFRYLLVVPVTRRKASKLFLFRLGHLVDSPVIAERRLVREGVQWVTEEAGRVSSAVDPVGRMEQTWLVAHFMRHSESRGALIVPLPRAGVPADLEQVLQDHLEQRHGGGGDGGDNSPEVAEER